MCFWLEWEVVIWKCRMAANAGMRQVNLIMWKSFRHSFEKRQVVCLGLTLIKISGLDIIRSPSPAQSTSNDLSGSFRRSPFS